MTKKERGAVTASRRDFAFEAMRRIQAEFAQARETALIRLDLPFSRDIQVYFKDETTHPTGSLKHRLARSLFVYAICNDWIDRDTIIFEASSGSTAVSEAYFASLLDLQFHAVMPHSTSVEKIHAIEAYGGQIHLIDDDASVSQAAARLARDHGGHFMDQFTYAERVTDWRGRRNIAEEIVAQLAAESCPDPSWIVCGAGTGGTLATIGRHCRYVGMKACLCLADPEDSIFHRALSGATPIPSRQQSLIEGVGRREMTGSFVPSLVDRAIAIPDVASCAATRVISDLIGKPCGGSTGTNFWAVAVLVSEMMERGETGSVVSLICDSGERYRSTYFNDAWVKSQRLDLAPYDAAMRRFMRTGRLQPP